MPAAAGSPGRHGRPLIIAPRLLSLPVCLLNPFGCACQIISCPEATLSRLPFSEVVRAVADHKPQLTRSLAN